MIVLCALTTGLELTASCNVKTNLFFEVEYSTAIMIAQGTHRRSQEFVMRALISHQFQTKEHFRTNSN